MPFRTILVAVSGGSASRGAVETACRLARRFNSHLEGLHIAVDAQVPTWPAAERSASKALAEAMKRAADEAAATARQAFDTAIARHALAHSEAVLVDNASSPPREASASWRSETKFDTTALARRARLFDLVVLGRSGRAVREPFGTTIEHTLLEAGRPVLVAASTALEKLGDTIALAWNDTPESARALAAAMPLLTQASRTHILCFGDMRMDELIQQLQWYGVRATGHRFRPLSEQRVETGELLVSATRDCGADLLVMGAYGRAPWREFLFGGATREVLNKNSFPILLAH